MFQSFFPLPPAHSRMPLSREADWQDRETLASSLAKLAKAWRRQKAPDVRTVVQSLATALRAEAHSARRGQLARAQAPMAERLGPEESARICLSAAESLASDWTKMNKFDPDQAWVRGLVAMMIRLPTDIAARTARLLAPVADSAVDRSKNSLTFFRCLDADDSARRSHEYWWRPSDRKMIQGYAGGWQRDSACSPIRRWSRKRPPVSAEPW